MYDIVDLILERVKDLNLEPTQKFRVDLSPDIMDSILRGATHNGTKYQKLGDDSYTFWIDGDPYQDGYWSPKVWVVDSLPKGSFNITLVDK